MKIFFLRIWAVWRRFRRGTHHRAHLKYESQIEALMRRANPFAGWDERANWMIDLAEWVRHEPMVSLLEDGAWQRVKHQRLHFLLNWLDKERDAKRVMQATLQKTLREAIAPELFADTGLPRQPAIFSELSEQLFKLLLPKPPAQMDLSALFTEMFPKPADVEWLMELDHATLMRLWKLAADDGISHGYRKQIDEALLYLVSMVISVGISSAFRQRLKPNLPLQATPFMALRRELEKYLFLANPHDESSLRSVRMLIAVCQAQTDRIYAHLDEYGVSVGLVYHVERMRSQLSRMARLINLRAAAPGSQESSAQVQGLLADLIKAQQSHASTGGLIKRSFSLLGRKMVERNADRGEQYTARSRSDYSSMLRGGCVGGIIMVLAILTHMGITGMALPEFFGGALASLGYAAGFLAIAAAGGVLAGRQPAVAAPVLASRMGALDTVDGFRGLQSEIAGMLRSQAAVVCGNLVTVIPTMLVFAVAILMLSGAPMLPPGQAQEGIAKLSAVGATPLLAVLTGILLWGASLIAGFADNWFALRRLKEGLAHSRRLVRIFGVVRMQRLAAWLERHFSGIVNNLSLAVLFGMTPVVAHFFGLQLDVRHVTLSAGILTSAAASLGWGILAAPEFWLAVLGIAVIALLNVGTAFACTLTLALHAREVPSRIRRLVIRGVLRKLSTSPQTFLSPQGHEAQTVASSDVHVPVHDDPEQHKWKQ